MILFLYYLFNFLNRRTINDIVQLSIIIKIRDTINEIPICIKNISDKEHIIPMKKDIISSFITITTNLTLNSRQHHQ